MRDHWWWRPGWRAGRRMYAWHVTFGDQPAVQDAITTAARSGLATVPPAAVTVTEIQLILLGRDEHVYQWETRATVSLGPAGRL